MPFAMPVETSLSFSHLEAKDDKPGTQKFHHKKRTFHRAINAGVVRAWAFIHMYHSKLLSARSNAVFSPLLYNPGFHVFP